MYFLGYGILYIYVKGSFFLPRALWVKDMPAMPSSGVQSLGPQLGNLNPDFSYYKSLF